MVTSVYTNSENAIVDTHSLSMFEMECLARDNMGYTAFDQNFKSRRQFWSFQCGVFCSRYPPRRLASAIQLLFSVSFLLLVLNCASCSRQSKVVALIPQTTANELWESAHAGAAHAAMETGWRIYWNGPSREDDIEAQITLVERAIERHYAGLILAPDHALALTTIVDRAAAQGLPIVILSSPLASVAGKHVTYLLNDEDSAGLMAAERIAQVIQGRGEVTVIGQTPDIPGTVARSQSFIDHLSRRFPGIHVVARRQGSFRLGQAEQSIEEVLESNPNLRAIFTIGISTTRAAYIALKNKGLTSKVKLVGSDQDLDLLYYLRRGEIDSIVAQNTFEMGQRALRIIASQAAGEKGNESVSSPTTIQVEPFLITRETIDHPEVQQLLSMDWRPQA
jgi:ribose transport system substrate-binding protein